MSTRTRIAPVTLPTIDMSASANSAATLLQSNTAFSYAVKWDGTTPTGDLALEVSNDYALDSTGQVANAGIWTVAPLNVGGAYATSIAISGNSGNGMIDGVAPTGVNAVRLAYTRSGGSGTMTLIVTAKVA